MILNIAAVKFDAFDNYYRKRVGIDQLDQLNMLIQTDGQNRIINEDTVQWWSKQDKKIVDRVFNEIGRIDLKDALENLRKFTWNARRVWCQGTDFDVTIIRNACAQYNMALPWEYWKSRDSRTVLDMVEIDLPLATHDALEDCYRQILGVQLAFEKLAITKYSR